MLTRLFCVLALVVAVAACGTSSSDQAGAGASSTAGQGASGTPVSPVDTRRLSPSEAARELVAVGDRVYFDFDQFTLSPAAQATLRDQARLLERAPEVNVIIEGHADARGTREYNLALGARRAASVRDFLIANGVAPLRVDTVSYGEERPEVIGDTESAFAQNRRAVTVITGAPAS